MTSLNSLLCRQIAIALFTGAVLLTAQPAAAGFKFTPAGNSSSPSAPPSARPLPSSMQPLQPLSAPIASSAPMADMAAPPTPMSLLPAAAPAQVPGAVPAAGMVEGFANDVPLTVALRQILPRGTMYNIADDVDIATMVSWNGGRPWQAVLDEMLGRAGLKAVYTANAITVQRAAGAPAMAAAPMMAPAPMPATMGTLSVPAASQQGQGYTVQSREVTSADPEFSGNAPAKPLGASMTGSMEPMPTAQQVLAAPDAPQVYDPVAPVMPYNNSLPDVAPVVSTMGNDTGAASPMTAAGDWQAAAGQSLHEVLSGWAQRANIELNWLSEYDYPIQASMTFNGTFEEAVRTLLAGFMNAAPAPVGRLHRNDQLGQMALIIEARGNLYNE